MVYDLCRILTAIPSIDDVKDEFFLAAVSGWWCPSDYEFAKDDFVSDSTGSLIKTFDGWGVLAPAM